MNSVLASIVGFLNGLIAIAIIVCGGLLGWHASPPEGDVRLALLGLAAGLLAALLVCGILAVFISMRAELIEIRQILDKKITPNSDNYLIS